MSLGECRGVLGKPNFIWRNLTMWKLVPMWLAFALVAAQLAGQQPGEKHYQDSV